LLFLVWVGALGCGDGEAPSHSVERDAGLEDAGTFVPPVPAPPVAPADAAAPMLTPCPAGWREVIDADDPDVVTCDPWPEGGPLACAADEAHFPGGGGCSRIGSACAGEWPADLPADAIYVRAGEPGGGDGTAGAPLGRIADAMAVAADGQTVALSTGDFAEEVTVDRAVTLRGACVAGTRIVDA